MQIFGIVLMCLGGVAFAVACVFFCLWRAFDFGKDRVGTAPGQLRKTKYKKDVPVYEKRSSKGPWRISMIIKHWSRGTYEYRVGEKTYRVRYLNFVRRREMPYLVTVAYLKSFPRISYVRSETNSHFFELYALGALLLAVYLALQGVFILWEWI